MIALLVLVLIGTFVFRQRIKEAISHAKPVKRFIAGKKKKEKEEKNIEEAKKAQESALKAIEDKLGEGAKPENSLDILSNIVATYLTNMFKLSSDSTETEIKGVMLKNGVKTGLVNRFLELYRQLNAKKYAGEEAEKEELENLKSRFIRLIEAITKGLVIAAPKKETNKISLFIRQSKKFLNNEDAVNAKQKYSEAMAIYKTLSNDEKKKYFKQVNELYDNIKDVQIKQTAENLKKTTMVVLFLLVFGLGTFFILKPAITGHVILDPNAELLIEDVSEQHAIVGEKFRLKVEVNGNQGKTYYMDNSDLFKIDQRGKIKFTPNIKQAGKHSVVIIVEDQRGIFVAKNFKLMIFEDQEALQDYNNREEIEEVTEEEIKEEEIEEVTEEDKTEETVDQEESIKQDVIEDEIMTGVENVSTEDVVIVNATIEETFNLTEKENETNKIVENKPREPIVEDEKRENNS